MRFDFWHYDPEERGWYIYGQGSVAEGGRQVVPDPNVSVYEFTGAMVAPPSLAPQDGPVDGSSDGDPVNLGTGLFVMDKTDLILPDIHPIAFTRTYRQRDNFSRAFGIGASHSFDLFLVGTTFPYTYIDLILPDGGRIHYHRISPGTSYEDAVYENTTSPTSFHKSRIAWNGNGYNITLKNGTVLSFGEGFEATRPGEAGLLKVQDRYGNTTSISRDSSGNVTRIVSPNGRWLQIISDAGNRITQVQDNIGRVVGYTYDANGRLWKVTDPASGVTEYGYDSSNQMLTIKDARGIVFLTNEYDVNGRVRKQTQADTTTYKFAYVLDGAGKVTQTDVTDPRGNVRRATFNSSGYTVTDTYAVGKPEQQTITYEIQSGTNFILSDTDALNRRTAYTYDANGNLTSIARLAGTPEAVTTTFTYDPTFNQVATVTDPLNHTTQVGYDNKGNVVTATDHVGKQATFAYNLAGQRISITDPLQHTMIFTHDAGDLAAVTDPLGRTVSYFVDGVGRPLAVTNGVNQKVRFEYDPLNQLRKLTDPLGAVTSFSYDPNGNLVSITDARNNVTSYSYDDMDRVSTRTDPFLRQESYLYDANGNLRQSTDRKNQVTIYSYDVLDRLTLITYADLSTTAYSYDNGNRLTSLVDSRSGSINYEYDNLDRVTAETTPQGIVSYSYDAAGRRISMTASGQATINYTYDNADRLTQITQGPLAVSFTYDDAYRRTSLTLPNGVLVDYGYDAASQLTSMTYRLGQTVLGDLTYDYDRGGNVVKMGGSFARTALPSAVSSGTYNGANQLTGWGLASLSYDGNGNLISDGINDFGWDARDQLESVAGPGLSATFQYDAFGRRTSKTINGSTTGFLYDGANLVQEQPQGGSAVNILSGGLDEVLNRNDSACSCSALNNHLGSTVALVDTAGAVKTQYSYEPFGKATANGAASSNSQQYTGRENDGIGLQYYRSRYYSPSLHRFISEDGIGFTGGDSNLYAYVFNNPTRYVDPSGNFLQALVPWAIACAEGALLNLALDLLSGRKPSWGSAGEGCLGGMMGLGLGKLLAWGLGKGLQGLSRAGGTAPRAEGLSRKIVSDPAATRPKLRKGVKEQVKQNAKKTPDGDYIDPNTGDVIPKEGPFDYGHKAGSEWRRTQQAARDGNWPRKKVIEHENNPDIRQIEDPASNRSHRYEKKP